MSSVLWTALYTKHLTQKRKVYQDGFVKSSGARLTLLDASKQHLETVSFAGALAQGVDSLPFERYLVEIDAVVASDAAAVSADSANAVDSGAQHRDTIAPSLTTVRKRPFVVPTREAAREKRTNVDHSMTSTATNSLTVTSSTSTKPHDVDLLDDDNDHHHHHHRQNDIIDDDQVLHASQTLSVPRSNEDLLAAILGAASRPTDNVVTTPTPAMPVVAKRRVGLKSIAATSNTTTSSASVPLSTGKFVSPANDSAFKWSHAEIVFAHRAMSDWLLRTNRIGARSIVCALTFAAWQQYTDAFGVLLREEVNLKLADVAQRYHQHARLLGACGAPVTVPRCRHGAAPLLTVSREGANHGRKFFSCRECELFVWADKLLATSSATATRGIAALSSSEAWRPSTSDLASLRKAGLHVHDDVALVRAHNGARYLRLNATWRAAAEQYARDDVWLLAADAAYAQPPITVLRAAFHGAARSGMMLVEPLTSSSAQEQLTNSASCYALRAVNAGSEFAMLDHLTNERTPTLLQPLLHTLLTGSAEQEDQRVRVDITRAAIDDIVAELVLCCRLNADQHDVLLRCSMWFVTSDDEPLVTGEYPILLVRGTFGSGKSTLLVACVLMIARVAALAGDCEAADVRVLVAASTNVAVDRILLGLLDAEYDDFLRVGSIRKIARKILSRSVHRARDDADEQKQQQDAARDLAALIAESRDASERAALTTELHAVQSGAARRRLDALRLVRVVGVTCLSSVSRVLDEHTFAFVFLDEASQMPEPLSLLPLRCGTRRVALIGDPCQLPPALFGVFGAKERAHAARHGLARTLFTRLESLKVPTCRLRYQYRCHPAIAKLANTLFYNNELIDAAAADDVSPLLDALPTLAFYDCANGAEKQTHGGSFENAVEARAIVRLLTQLRDSGVHGRQIGVICLYRSQAALITSLLTPIITSSTSSTTVTTAAAAVEATSVVPDDDAAPPPVKADDDDDAVNGEEENETPTAETTDTDDDNVHVATVDAFQGAERDVVIISTVRTERVGFLDSPERVNVALTRARRHLLIFGRASNLRADRNWHLVLDACAERRALLNAHQ